MSRTQTRDAPVAPGRIGGATIPARFEARVAATPQRPALWFETATGWEEMTWSALERRAAEFGTGLQDLGHHHGDAVAILGPTRHEWTISDLGALGVGAIVVGVYPTLTPEGIAYVLEHSGATTLVVAGQQDLDRVLSIPDGMPKVERIVAWDPVDASRDARITPFDTVLRRGEALLETDPDRFRRSVSEVRADDVALIVYTSGTTGPPKGAVLTHANVIPVMDALQAMFPNLGPQDVTIAFLPLAHVAGHILEQFGRIQVGFGACYCPDIKRVLDVFEAARPTLFGSVPRLYEKVLARVEATLAGESGPKRVVAAAGLRAGIQAARRRREGARPGVFARIRLALADRLVLRKIRSVFGGRCRLFIVGAAPISLDVLEFCEGIGIPIYEVYGMTETASLISANRPGQTKLGSAGRVIPGGEMRLAEDGEILFRGPTVFPGYLHNEEATRETVDPDGWLHTGDIGEIDDDGYLSIVDRKKDLIITAGGKNVAPSNIENLVRQIPIVGEVLVHGDRRKYLTALLSLDLEELDRFADEHQLGVVDRAKIVANVLLRHQLQRHIDAVNAKLAAYEQIRGWDVAPEPFSIENGMLTPTLKVKRKQVESRYADLLDALYAQE